MTGASYLVRQKEKGFGSKSLESSAQVASLKSLRMKALSSSMFSKIAV